MSEDTQPAQKKARTEVPEPPPRPMEGPNDDEAMAVVAANVAPDDGMKNVRSAFKKRLERIDYQQKDPENDLKHFLENFQAEFTKVLNEELKRKHGLKVYLNLTVAYKSHEFPEREAWVFYLGSSAHTVINESQVPSTVEKIFKQLETKNDNLVRTKTGLYIEQIHWASLFLTKFAPLEGGTYTELPRFLLLKKAIINIKNKDNQCFAYCIVAHFQPVKGNSSNPAHYRKYFSQYGLDKIQYPVTFEQIPEIEAQLNIGINVFSFFDDEGKARYPKYISPEGKYKDEINLLYWNEHFAYIKKFSAFIADLHSSTRKKIFCKRCFGLFTNKDTYESHLPYCETMGIPDPIFIFPIEGTILMFKNIRYMEMVPFVIYADFECLLIDTKQKAGEMTEFYAKHIPCSVAFKVLCRIPNLHEFPLELHVGPDSAKWFLQRLSDIETECLEILYDEKRMIFSDADKEAFDKATECYICNKMFNNDTRDKVRDHDHLTGLYRGAAHCICNLRLRKTAKIPVFLHNFRGYDSHLVSQALEYFPQKDIRIIGQGLEKYLTLQFGDHILFKDSYQFLSASLEQLAKNLFNSGGIDRFPNLFKELQNEKNEDKIDLLIKKGIYPYEYMNHWERFKERTLPPKEEFRNSLRLTTQCTDEEYTHAQNVWKKFNCKDLEDYHNVYLKTDVLLLTDIFELFRKFSKENYKLDPAHYVSSPQLSWDAMLLFTDVNLELVSFPQMFKMIDNGIRGGVAMIVKRYAKANNPLLKENYNPTEPISYIVYLDANNLYGWAMSQYLP